MSKKIKIEIEITGIEDWNADWDNSEAIGLNLRIIRADLKRAIVDSLGTDWDSVKITNAELVNGQPEPPTT